MNKTTPYEIIGNTVRINNTLYPLHTTGGVDLATWPDRQRGHVYDGSYGPEAQAYALACQEAGTACNLGWSGVVNSMGDHASVNLPSPVKEVVGR